MKYISYNDQELLSESYNNVKINQLIREASIIYPDASYEELLDILVQENVIEEGMATWLKSRLSQAGGALKGTAQQVAGKAEQIGGKLAGGAQELTGKALNKMATGAKIAGDYLGTSDPNAPPDPTGTSKAQRAAKSFTQRGVDKAAAAQASGQQKIDQGKIQGQLSKYQTAINSTVTDVDNTLANLNMPIQDRDKFKKELFKLITKHLGLGQARGEGGTFTGDRQFTGSTGATGTITQNY